MALMEFAEFDRRPIVVAIAGPNGAGKTTFFHVHEDSAAEQITHVWGCTTGSRESEWRHQVTSWTPLRRASPGLREVGNRLIVRGEEYSAHESDRPERGEGES